MKIDPSRVSPAGYWRHAWEYLCAAENVVAGPHKNLMFPALYLCGQSIELFLKGFLLKRGESPSQVEGYNHRLVQLVKRARLRRLGREAKLSQRDLAAIAVLAETYSHYPYQLRYFVRGVVTVPPVDATIKAAARTCNRVARRFTQASARHTHQRAFVSSLAGFSGASGPYALILSRRHTGRLTIG